MEIEDIKVRKPFEDNSMIIIEGRIFEGRPGLSARLFMPPDRYEYLGLYPLQEDELTEPELEAFLEEIEGLARKVLRKNKLEIFLAKKGFKRT